MYFPRTTHPEVLDQATTKRRTLNHFRVRSPLQHYQFQNLKNQSKNDKNQHFEPTKRPRIFSVFNLCKGGIQAFLLNLLNYQLNERTPFLEGPLPQNRPAPFIWWQCSSFFCNLGSLVGKSSPKSDPLFNVSFWCKPGFGVYFFQFSQQNTRFKNSQPCINSKTTILAAEPLFKTTFEHALELKQTIWIRPLHYCKSAIITLHVSIQIGNPRANFYERLHYFSYEILCHFLIYRDLGQQRSNLISL